MESPKEKFLTVIIQEEFSTIRDLVASVLEVEANKLKAKLRMLIPEDERKEITNDSSTER